MHLTRDKKWLLEEKYGGRGSEAFATDCERLKSGEPLGYIIGYVPFLDCKIWLDSHPLIPRPETEYWTEKAIHKIRTLQQVGLTYLLEISPPTKKEVRVMDLCAGSGCIGVSVAKAIPDARVDFVEIDPKHHKTIEKNLRENGIEKTRCQIVGGNLFEEISTNSRYDFILTNPPYIDLELNQTDKSVKEHEPDKALYGGQGGVELIKKIIANAPAYLRPNGQLWIEHEPEQTEAIYNLSQQHGFKASARKDQYNIERYSTLVIQ